MHSSSKNDLGDPVDGRRALVDRILASPHFSKSPRLSQFLSFIADRAISGKSAEINEQLIGVHVFGRPPAYSSGEDSIVRSQARFFRQRLDDFFAGDGKSEVLRIRIPKGAYVPVFEAVSFGTQSAAKGESQAAEVTFETSAPTITPVEDAMVPLAQRSVIPHDPVFAPASWPRRNLYLTLTAAALLLAVSVWGIVLHFKKRNIVDSSHRLWAAFYENGDPPIIVPSDSTLVLLEELTGTSVRLSDYLNAGTLQTRLVPQSNLNVTIGDIFSHQYTSIVDLSLTARIVRLPEAARVSPEIRYARDLRLNDLKTRSAVLIGGARTNPWIELFSSKTFFYVDYDRLTKHNVVYDRAPKSGQPPTYSEASDDPEHHAYGLVAFTSGINPIHQALLIEGTSMAGTECAADFLTDEATFTPFVQRIQRSDGSIPHFEVLLETKSIGGNAPFPRIVDYRVLN